jgi:sugar phosphate isomerase/epimerase
MHTTTLSRRDFLSTTAAGLAVSLLPHTAHAASSATRWPIGCFNRPWTKWSYDDTLDATKAAGYTITGLLSPTKDDVFTSANATPAYLAALKAKIAARGLKVNMTALRVKTALPLAEAIADTRQQIANGHTALKTVGHANFKIWYDAGNIIYYTGKDPVAELEPILAHVTGFCAKDCAAPKSDVMIQFGTGKVDFAAVFKKLKSGGFNGPIMVECCKIGATAAETMAHARANREFLEKVLATV